MNTEKQSNQTEVKSTKEVVETEKIVSLNEDSKKHEHDDESFQKLVNASK